MSDEVPDSVKRTRAKKMRKQLALGVVDEAATEEEHDAEHVNPNLGRQWTVHGEKSLDDGHRPLGMAVSRVSDLPRTSALMREIGYRPTEATHEGRCLDVGCNVYDHYLRGGLSGTSSLTEKMLHDHKDNKRAYFATKADGK